MTSLRDKTSRLYTKNRSLKNETSEKHLMINLQSVQLLQQPVLQLQSQRLCS